MNKPLATALLATSSLLLADGALAADACGTPRNAFDSVYCRSGEFSQADRELNQQFGTLRKHLNDGQKALLKKSQIAWIKGATRPAAKARTTVISSTSTAPPRRPASASTSSANASASA